MKKQTKQSIALTIVMVPLIASVVAIVVLLIVHLIIAPVEALIFMAGLAFFIVFMWAIWVLDDI